MRTLFATLVLSVCLGCFGGCGDDGGSSGDGGWTPPPPALHCEQTPNLNEGNDPTTNPVWSYNSWNNGNVTRRWPDGSYVTVRFFDARYTAQMQNEALSQINTLIPGVNVQLVPWGGVGDASIEVLPLSTLGHSGSTNIVYSSGNNGSDIFIATIYIGTSVDTSCLKCILLHELLHAIGFYGDTNNGGLMDAWPGHPRNREITSIVQKTIEDLYSMPPGSVVGP